MRNESCRDETASESSVRGVVRITAVLCGAFGLICMGSDYLQQSGLLAPAVLVTGAMFAGSLLVISIEHMLKESIEIDPPIVWIPTPCGKYILEEADGLDDEDLFSKENLR